MSLSKKTLIDKIEILENNYIQVRERTDIIENGAVLSSSFNRWVLNPGSDLSDQNPKIVAIANIIWAKEE